MDRVGKITRNTLLSLVIFYLLFKIRGILPPFVAGIILAYFFHPLADRFEKKIPRNIASLTIITVFTLSLAIIMVFVLPILFNQLTALIKELVVYLGTADNFLYQKVLLLLERFGIENGRENIKLYFENNNRDIVRFFGRFLNNLFSSSAAFINVIYALFITPITTYYFLKDWHVIIAKIGKLIPKRNRKLAKEFFKEVDYTLSAYVKGQIAVCLILGIFYAILLTLIGLKFGIFIGILAGVLTIMPYFGAYLGSIAGLIVAYFQWGLDIQKLLIVFAVFVLGQFLEGNFVTPQLMEKKIHVHPMWIIFALFAGGALMGFWGLVLALPIAGILGVSIKFLIKIHNGKA